MGHQSKKQVGKVRAFDPTAPKRSILLLFYGMALFSGAAGLTYEITWARMLGLTFGSTTLSAAAVIAGFMGGMGLGAWLYHKAYEHAERPLVLYVVLEFGIAITTAALTQTFYYLPDLFASTCHTVPPGLPLILVRFIWVFVLLLIPSMLMGATFPALCTVMIRSIQGVDRHLGMIYGINTIGAAGGAFLAGLFLIEALGLTMTVTVANVINVAVAICALYLLRTPQLKGDVRTVPPEEAALPTDLPAKITGVVLIVSGFATLAYEILWFRALRYLIGNSTYALSIILVVFLIGLGLGALLLQRIVRRGKPELDLALCQCGIAVTAMLCIAAQWFVANMPAIRESFSIFNNDIRYSPWWWRLMLDGGLATMTMLPATLFMGLSFPLAGRLFLGDVRKLGTRIGGAYFLANIGSILGSLLAAVLLLPLAGTVGGTKIVALLNLALGGLLIFWIRKRYPGWKIPTAVTTLILLVLVLLLPNSVSRIGEPSPQSPGIVIYSQDGDLATVEVLQDPRIELARSMTVDGCAIGWSEGYRQTEFYRKQVILAHLPMVVDPRIRTTLNVGLGSSATLHTLAQYPELEVLDCVEISQAVVDAAAYFPESLVLKDPRVHVIVDDAVHYLLQPGKQYDLIVSDGKQDPRFSGNAPLLCREFYQYAFDRLTEDGLFVQWFPMATLHADTVLSLRALCAVFPEVEILCLPPDSMLMIASRKPIFERERMTRERYDALPVARDLAMYLIDNPSALLSWRSCGRERLTAALGDGPMSTWDRLYIDFTAFKATYQDWLDAPNLNMAMFLKAEGMTEIPDDPPVLDQPEYAESGKLIRQAYGQLFAGQDRTAKALAEQAVRANPGDRAAAAVLNSLRRGARREMAPP